METRLINVPLDLTIAIPTKDAEGHLKECLDAIPEGLARRVVIIDSGGTDSTLKIAREQGAEVVDFLWDGRFPKKRNWFLRNHPPGTEWVLFLDADEILTPAFRSEIERTLPGSTKSGYWLNYTIHFLGKPLRGGYPLKKLALFRVGAGEYERIEEDHWSALDMEVHEHPVIDGEVGEIRARIDHRESESMARYIAKHNEYSSWEAARIITASSKMPTIGNWTWKQKVKSHLAQSFMAGPLYFFGSYFLIGGFRDGIRGFVFAMLKASYFTQIYCKICEMKNSKNYS